MYIGVVYAYYEMMCFQQKNKICISSGFAYKYNIPNTQAISSISRIFIVTHCVSSISIEFIKHRFVYIIRYVYEMSRYATVWLFFGTQIYTSCVCTVLYILIIFCCLVVGISFENLRLFFCCVRFKLNVS